VKHGEGRREPAERVLAWLGRSLSERQWELLEVLGTWLKTEAITTGGLGPNEGDHIWERHVADSLAFWCGWSTPPRSLVDVGSGVGLPGIPLAVAWPTTAVTLLDRSGRRVDLAKRAVRTLGVDNVEVRLGDAFSEGREWDAAVFRAVFPWEKALEAAGHLVDELGSAAVGLRGDDVSVSASWPGRRVRRIDVPTGVLDAPASLLIMGPREH